ncbi:MAG: sigma-54-dependent Fis family transcriptional regulator [Deltaproteobacteria bacterium]|nr:MAG: sigma-54-dependent Fis family transcriptional regulator [Deltaproteobacteria bacterium]
MARVLVVDDEPKLGKLVSEALALDGHAVTRAGGGRAALAELQKEAFEIVVADLRMPDVDGLAVLQAARARIPPAEVILMTAHATAESAVAAMKAGAADYLIKPFAFEELRLRVQRLADQRAAHRKADRLVERLTPGLVAESAAMKEVLAAARRVAATDASVLLLGESGTGKNQLARLIHYSGKRAAAPLVEVHCAALPEALLESELFGHEKGAFTGAHERKIGHLAAADTGTLFLDEIGEVTPATQVKLLRFLQEREFVPVGSTQTRKVDVRVVAATNRDLDHAVKAGTFREDFYYRLNVFAIHLPPLRDRREDILPLADRFLSSRGVPPSRLSAAARDRLHDHAWPGNVREMENALERALILAGDDEIGAEHFGRLGRASERSEMRGQRAADVLREGFNLDDFERELIDAAIERAGGNKAAAARLLGITRRRLYSTIQSLSARTGEDDSSSE